MTTTISTTRAPTITRMSGKYIPFIEFCYQFKLFITKVELLIVQSLYIYEGSYVHHIGAAVPGNNIATFKHKSVLECKGLCDADMNCLAIEYATVRDAGSSTVYEKDTCILQSSSAFTDHSDKNGYKNLDLYVKQGNIM